LFSLPTKTDSDRAKNVEGDTPLGPAVCELGASDQFATSTGASQVIVAATAAVVGGSSCGRKTVTNRSMTQGLQHGELLPKLARS
jgi:hypothetical protein